MDLIFKVILLAFCCLGYLKCELMFGCAVDYCDKQLSKCEEINNEDTGRLIKNASLCGCCHVRMISLANGDKCRTVEETPIPRQECGPGLQCNQATQTCVSAKRKCNLDLEKFSAETGNQEITMGRPKPQCDEYGDYKPVQCKAGQMCYCVDQSGKRIFGEAPYKEKDNINCTCSRDYENLKQGDLVESSNPGVFLRCDRSGDYSGPQCTDSQCFCVDKFGELKSQPVPRANGTKVLSCFVEGKEYKEFITPCLKKVAELKTQLENYTKGGISVIGIDLPQCSLDGTYAPKQCQGKECYCVDHFNRRYNGTGVPRYSQEADKMTCNCVREKDLLKGPMAAATEVEFAKYKCLPNGSYLPIQCTTSVCYCVDENGYQTGKPALVAQRSTLVECYRPEYENILLIMWD